jgi:hypothetical protein
MPAASRACGERICRVGVRSGFLDADFLDADFRLGAGFRLDEERDEARDDERRDGEVFVAIGP